VALGEEIVMRARISTLVSVLVVGLVLAGAVAAQVRVKENVNISLTGEITAIDASAGTLTVKGEDDDGIVYSVDRSATIMSGGKDLALGDLKTGWSVAVNGHDDGATKRVSYIKVVKAP